MTATEKPVPLYPLFLKPSNLSESFLDEWPNHENCNCYLDSTYPEMIISAKRRTFGKWLKGRSAGWNKF